MSKFFASLLIFGLVSSFPLYAQQVIHGTVKDPLGKPLEFATIALVGKPIGTYSRADGSFSLSMLPTDSIQISYIGYQSVSISFATLKQLSTIVLKPVSTQLPEVVIRRGKPKLETIGNHRLKSRYFYIGLHRVAMLLANPSRRPGTIEELRFQIRPPAKKFRQGTTYQVAIRLYQVNEQGMPGKDVLPKPLIIQGSLSAHELRIPLSAYQIPFSPAGIFIGMDLIGLNTPDGIQFYSYEKVQYFPAIPFTYESDTRSYSASYTGSWSLMLPTNTAAPTTGGFNPCFGAVIALE